MRSSQDSPARPTLWILLAAGLLFLAAGATAEQTVLVPYGFDCWMGGGQGGFLYKTVEHCQECGFHAVDYDESSFLLGYTPFAQASPDEYYICPQLFDPLDKVRTWIPDLHDLLVRRHVELCSGTKDVEVRAAIDNDLALWVNGVQVLPVDCPLYILEPDGVTLVCSWENCAVQDRAIFEVPDELLVDGDNVFAWRSRDRGIIAYLDVEILADVSEAVCNQPPDCSEAVASLPTIWPPNHKKWQMVDVLGVVDPDGDPVAIAIDWIFQDEPTLAPSSGVFCPDAEIDGEAAWIRAEREGHLDGRVYHVGFTATDPAGEECCGSVAVCVPHDQAHLACGDQGPLYDSTSCD